MAKLLDDGIQQQVQEVFKDLVHPVAVLYFKRKENCDYCEETEQLLDEVIQLSDKLSLEVYDMDDDAAVAHKFHVDKAPGFVLVGKADDQHIDYGVRFAGIPSGHEFTSLINDLLLVSSGYSGLNEQTREFLANLTEPVLLQVFVTPTCPYCPRAVVLAHQMAMESPLIQAEAIQAMEFPELSDRFAVSGVPQTTINSGAANVVGAVPETYLVKEIQNALDAVNKGN